MVFRCDLLKPRDVYHASFHVCKAQQFFNVLFFWRAVALILSLGTCISNATHQLGLIDKYEEFFLSFTNWCFIFLAVYFLIATCLSFADWRRKRYAYFVSVPTSNSTTESLLFGSNTIEEEDDPDPTTETKTPIIHRVFWVMFEVAFTVAVFVDLVFWTTLYTGSLDAIVIVLHALNGMLMLGELCLNSLVFAPGHIIFVWIILLMYLIEVWVWHAVGNVWAYAFLDYSNNLAFVYYPALFVTATVTFFIGFLLVKLRDRNKRAKAITVQVDQHFSF